MCTSSTTQAHRSGVEPVRHRRPSAARRPAPPEPWAGDVTVLRLIEVLDGEMNDCVAALRRLDAHHAHVPLLMSAPGIGWVLGYPIAGEIGDITRFATAEEAGRLHRTVPPGGSVRAA